MPERKLTIRQVAPFHYESGFGLDFVLEAEDGSVEMISLTSHELKDKCKFNTHDNVVVIGENVCEADRMLHRGMGIEIKEIRLQRSSYWM